MAAKTVSEIYEQGDKIARMSYDQLSAIASIIPYIQQRQHAARYFLETRSDHEKQVENIRHINQHIIQILGLDL